MWFGVTRGFAGIKFSGAIKAMGKNVVTARKRIKAARNPNISFTE